ncbi:Crp/Fnr family transcriptional regulator [Actinacidiphila acididurans]|uniref:Crp/Fnr family transcriptional regulator n=1 Tax=Actinacidiphila acididurans TaxID=2784346 RepID=UPI0027DD7590|nr:Crp/Fnr family transcriptional regulator [Actinacidiphila acididurans]
MRKPGDGGRAGEGFWSLLDDAARQQLQDAGHVKSFPVRTHLVRQNEVSEHVFVLRRGCVKIYADTGTGYQAVLALRNDGDLLGEQAGLDRQPRSASIAALMEVEALVIPAGRFAALLRSTPTVAFAVQQVLSGRLREADRQRAVTGSTSVEARLAALVLDLAGRYGTAAAGRSVRIDLPLSQDDLAGLVLGSRRTVARALEEWRRLGILTTGRQMLELAPGARAQLRTRAAGAGPPGHSWSQE